MTPAELRRAASVVMEHVDHSRFDDSLLFREIVWALADHILSTVREDDGEAITREWLMSFADRIEDDTFIVFESGPLYLYFHKDASAWSATWEHVDDNFEGEWPLPIRSRGQLRRLLEGLGIA